MQYVSDSSDGFSACVERCIWIQNASHKVSNTKFYHFLPSFFVHKQCQKWLIIRKACLCHRHLLLCFKRNELLSIQVIHINSSFAFKYLELLPIKKIYKAVQSIVRPWVLQTFLKSNFHILSVLQVRLAYVFVFKESNWLLVLMGRGWYLDDDASSLQNYKQAHNPPDQLAKRSFH